MIHLGFIGFFFLAVYLFLDGPVRARQEHYELEKYRKLEVCREKYNLPTEIKACVEGYGE